MIDLRVSALLLAPGTIAGPGQFPPTDSKTTVARCLDTILASGIQDTVVVLNGQAESMSEYRDLPVRFAMISSRGAEIAESVRIGFDAFGHLPSGVLLCLAEHPSASVRTMRTLALEHYSFCTKILIPAYHGKRGHPMLFPRDILSEVLAGLSLREVIRKDSKRVRMVDVPDQGVVLARNTRTDYEDSVKKVEVLRT